MPYFACTLMLDRGSIVLPGNWGRIVRLIGSAHQEWQRETILEEIRKAEFPNLPSRLECAFVIDQLDEAQYYIANFARLALLYEVALIDNNFPTHEADWKGTGPYDQSNDWARRYWRGDVMPHPETHFKLRERLTLSRLRIEKKV
jgi:Protein of unknown function (DUF2441)